MDKRKVPCFLAHPAQQTVNYNRQKNYFTIF